MTGTDQHDYGDLLQRALTALDEMEAKLVASERRRHEPIAVVGMGMRMPGDVRDPEAFWELLMSGRDAVTEVPADRWDLDAVYDPAPGVPGKSYTRWGAYLDDIDRFDATFFGISPREALSMDPQQRLLLEVAWEAFENAGIAPPDMAGSATGVFVGMTGTEYSDLALQGGVMSDVDAYFASGVAQSVAAGRLAYVFDFHGPALAIDTACSSSLLAAHMACQSLRSGECNAALAGGVNVMLSPDGHILTSQARMMSFEGRCKTFDAAADGYVRGEGCALVVLKRLSDVVADGDRILATIRGSAANQDGRSNGLTAPNAAAQEAVMRAALADAGIEPADVGFVECHGTGTTLGDPIEIRALQAVFGKGRKPERPLRVQSVKTNIGHLEAAAGVAGLCKLVLAVRHGSLPTHLHLTEPNPYIPWRDIAVVPETGPAPWQEPDGASRIGGISSFGFSGTNVHMLVDEAPTAPVDGASPRRPHSVYPVSARTEAALDDLARRHASALVGADALELAAAATTAATGRAHLEERIAVVATDADEAAHRLGQAVDGELSPDVVRGRAASADDGVVMLFTGQGSQVPGMGRRLYETEPAFRASLDESAALLREIGGIDLLDVMFDTGPRPEGESVHDTRFTQPAIFAYEVAMADLWRSWGVEPAAVLGHSIGELAAAHVAGVMSRRDGLTVVEARGRLMQALPRDGGMAALLTDLDTALAAIAPWTGTLSVAAVNGPRSVVISGRLVALDEFLAAVAEQGIKTVRLEVSHAFHSPLMDPMLDEFEAVVASVDLRDPDIELISNRTAASATAGLLTSPRYWREHVREAVRFAESVQATVDLGLRTFLEVGPAATLTAMATSCGVPTDATFVASARATADNDARELQRALSALHVAGVPIDWSAYTAGSPRRPDGVPTYPFERQRHWHPAVNADRRSAPAGAGGAAADLPLPGQLLRSPRLADQVYSRVLTPSSPAWLADHVVYGATIVPATAYLEMMRLAGRATTGSALDVVDVRIDEPLVLGDDLPTTVQTILTADQRGYVVEVHSATGDGWHHHATGRLVEPSNGQCVADPDPVDAVWSRCEQAIAGAEYYDALSRLGVDYGPTFRCIERAGRRDGEVVAVLRAPGHGDTPPAIHPALADACLQVLGLAMPGAGDLNAASGDAYLPVGVQRWHVPGDASGTLTAHGCLRPGEGPITGQVAVGDLWLYDASGALVAMCEGVRFKRAPRAALAAVRAEQEWFYTPRWEPVPLPAADGAALSGHWLVAAPGDLGASLAQRIRTDGASAEVLPLADIASCVGDSSAGVLAGVVVVADPSTPAHAGAGALAGLLSSGAAAGPGVSFTVVTAATAAVVPGDRVSGYEQAALWGVARVARSENLQQRCRIVDLADLDAGDTVERIVAELAADDAVEPQLAWRDGVRYALRLAHSADIDELVLPDGPYELQISERGRLDALRVVAQGLLEPGAGEVLIDIRATGLNFRDVLNALGTYAGDALSLGNECSGTVVAVGEGVTRVRPGDRVMAVAVASFATRCLVPEAMVTRQPAGWSDAESATVPIAFLTADYALNHLGRMRTGDRVLIHAAAGGVGLAAVQLAQQAGAEVFGTAGSDVKRAALRALGVEHVYDSRRTDFRDEILRDTGGEGVDLVLNSLSGDSIAASVDVLSPTGRFLEIGLAGIWDAARFHSVRPDAEYHVIFLGQACVEQPDVIAARFDALAAACEGGELRPLPLVAFDIRHSATAFRYMAQARQIGKVVITADVGWNVPEVGGTWIVTGGLGGLGMSIASELAGAGATRLVLCSRGEPGDEAAAAVEALRLRCTDVRVVAVDVADADAVANMVRDVTADGERLRGVVHAAAVLDDAMLRDLAPERFEAVMRPKVLGAQYLAAAADPHHPDHFVLFSAGAGLLGSPGQGNYAAANAVIDALAHARRVAGRPAQTIDWGPWTTVGMASRMGESALRRWDAQGVIGLDPEEGRRAFRSAISAGDAQVAVLKLRWPALLHHFSKHGIPPILQELVRSEQRRTVAGAESPPAIDFVAELNGLALEQRGARLLEEVRTQVLRVLGLDPTYPIGTAQGLTDVGMDSLMAVELSNRLSVLVDRTLPSTLAFEYPTLGELTDYLASDLFGGRADATSSGDAATRPQPDPATDDTSLVESMSADEVTTALMRELDDAGY